MMSEVSHGSACQLLRANAALSASPASRHATSCSDPPASRSGSVAVVADPATRRQSRAVICGGGVEHRLRLDSAGHGCLVRLVEGDAPQYALEPDARSEFRCGCVGRVRRAVDRLGLRFIVGVDPVRVAAESACSAARRCRRALGCGRRLGAKRRSRAARCSKSAQADDGQLSGVLFGRAPGGALRAHASPAVHMQADTHR